MERIELKVRQAGGTYSVAHKGTRASCTSGPIQAAERLASKLWGQGAHQVERSDKPATSDLYPLVIIRSVEATRCPRTMELGL